MLNRRCVFVCLQKQEGGALTGVVFYVLLGSVLLLLIGEFFSSPQLRYMFDPLLFLMLLIKDDCQNLTSTLRVTPSRSHDLTSDDQRWKTFQFCFCLKFHIQ